MTRIVDIEIAKLAKKAGFDEHCDYRYTDVPINGLTGKSCNHFKNSMYSNAKIERFTAPTYSQLNEWLVKQGLFLILIPFSGEDVERYIYGFGYSITVVNIENRNILSEELYQPNINEYGFENRFPILYKGMERSLNILINLNHDQNK